MITDDYRNTIVIDPTDLCRSAEARRILKDRDRSLLSWYSERFAVVKIDHVVFYSRAALHQYVAERPDVLTPRHVAAILGVSRQRVLQEPLNTALAPARRSWGGFRGVREYCPERVERVREVREQARMANGRVRRNAYASLLTEASTAPSSVGLAPTVIGTTAGKAPRQTIKAKGDKASRVSEATERVKARAVNRCDRRRTVK